MSRFQVVLKMVSVVCGTALKKESSFDWRGRKLGYEKIYLMEEKENYGQ